MLNRYTLSIRSNRAETIYSFTKDVRKPKIKIFLLPIPYIESHLYMYRLYGNAFIGQRSLISLSSKIPLKKDNTARVRNRIFEIAINNRFTHFVTITIDSKKEDRYNSFLVSKKLRKVFNNYKSKVDKDFVYLVVPEFHQDGAIHFHGLFRLSNSNNDIEPLGLDKKSGHAVFRSKWLFNSFGANRLVSFPKEDTLYVALYITKYITKSICNRPLNRSYFCSLGLKGNDEYFARGFTLDDVRLFGRVFVNENVKFRVNGFTAYLPKRNLSEVRHLRNLYDVIGKVFTDTYHYVSKYDDDFGRTISFKSFMSDNIDWEKSV